MQGSRRPSRISRTILAALVSFVAACQNPADGGDSRACQQTYEFSNTGCFEIVGQVVGSTGQPLRGILVLVEPLSRPSSTITGGGYTTDAAGRFGVRGARMGGGPPAGGAPDTVSVRVFAADSRLAGYPMPATRDSVLKVVTLSPVGAIPQTAEVRITLAVP